MIRILISLLVLSNVSYSQKAKYFYPPTPKINITDTFFSTVIQDPYRWLEDQYSIESKKWLEEQAKFTEKYMESIPNNFSLREQIRRNTHVQYFSPEKCGKYYFVLRTVYGGKQLRIYYTEDLRKGNWDELFVGKDLGVKNDQIVDIDEFSVSKDSKYIAYSFDTNGSDWKEIKVGDLNNQKNLQDHLYNVKHSSIIWRKDGFYYMRYEKSEDKYKQLLENPRLYYHKIGTNQESDSLIFKRDNAPNNLFRVMVSSDEKFLVIEDNNANTNIKTYYYYDFENQNQKTILPLIKKTGKIYYLLAKKKDELLFLEEGWESKRIVNINLNKPEKHNEIYRLDEKLTLKDVRFYKNNLYMLCYYNQQEYIVIKDENKNILKKVEIPFGAYCSFLGIDYQEGVLLIQYGSILHPPVLASIHLTTFKFEVIEPVRISYSKDDFVVEKVLYKSDTAMVPMLLLYNKKIKNDGNNPTLIEFYGGYGRINMPSYDAGKISFVENGGIYAYAMIRGGGEKGEYWWKDGSLHNRQNSINDIINASLFLTDRGYTKSEKIAISGVSHGGLMAAAAITKRPDLFGAAIPVVGVYDMLRFEKFTIGSIHHDEYGSINDSLDFIYLKSFSPIHNVKTGVKYPKILVMTSEFDDRVPPLHSYKFVATMQNEASVENPVLLRVEKNAGHSGARSYEKYLDETTDFYSFILNALEVKKFK